MRVLKITAAIFLVMNALFFGAPMFLDAKYDVSHTREFDLQHLDRGFELLADYQLHSHWNPWINTDSTMELAISDPSRGLGASYTWRSENSGTGHQKIVDFQEKELIQVDFDFGDMGQAKGSYKFTTTGEKFLITWRFWGESNSYIGRYMTHFMDDMMVPIMDVGFDNLQDYLKKQPQSTPHE